MQFEVENQGSKVFLVYEMNNEDILDELSFGMLSNNAINGVAAVQYSQMDEKRFLKFDITSTISSRQYLNDCLNREKLVTFLYSICQLLINAEEFMIEKSSYLYDLDYVFVDVTNSEAKMLCIPLKKYSANVDFVAFFKEILFNIRYDQTENSNYIAKIMNYINSGSSFSLDDFSNLLKEIKYNTNGQSAQASMNSENQGATGMPVNSNLGKPETVGGSGYDSSNEAFIQSIPPAPSAMQYSEPKNNMVNINKPATPARPAPAGPAPARTVTSVAMQQNPNMQNRNVPANNAPAQKQKSMSMFKLLMHYSKENKAIYDEQKKAKKQGASVQKQQAKGMDNRMQVPGKQGPTPGMNPGMVPQPGYQQNVPQMRTASASFGETTVLNSGAAGETTVLNAVVIDNSKSTNAYLIRIKNNERIPINKGMFRIGKEKSNVDYFISDNTAISRSHAYIIMKGNKYFIVDTNSKNHTIINGNVIQSNIEVEIMNETKIQLANEVFMFYIE